MSHLTLKIMKNSNFILTLLFISFFISTINAQSFNVQNQDGDDVIRLSAVDGGIISNYLWTISNEPTLGNTNYSTLGLALSPGINNGVTGYADIDSIGSNAILALGDAHVTGNLWIGSDRKLKKDIQEMDAVLEDIKKLSPRWYQYDHPQLGNILPKGQQTGFIAQELQEVFPHLVTTKQAHGLNTENALDDNPVKYNAVNYIGLVPILIKAIQEQQDIIEQYQTQVEDQENRINRLESLLLDKPVSPSNKENSNEIRLDQNIPNPFRGSTTINYFIPQQINQAKLIVVDTNGRQIQSHDLESGKEASIEISLHNLPSGNYVYSIISNKGNSGKYMIYKN